MKYDHRSIEKKWQTFWHTNKTFQSKIDANKPKYYVLDMFPYPSGSGLHVGHVVGYTATDIMARYKRAMGYNVLHPMGWDSFGLPAEQYAIRTGTHPAESTKANIDTFRRQLQALGLSYDWDRELATSDPSYYKWTQWIFTKLYEKGLAYEAEVLVNYCPFLGTVLANEEVENGRSKEGGYPIERRPLRQWMLKITAYAERLLEDLDELDWPESLKKLQVNWIGRSEGASIVFPTAVKEQTISVFTTRPDTLFGVSYLVLAPEHPLVPLLTTKEQKEAVQSYQKSISSKGDLERSELNDAKTGVFIGAYATHPISHEPLPIWIADYVLMQYGTGAVMAVPAHDARDFAFAELHHLPIHPVIDPEGAPSHIRQAVLAKKLCWEEEGVLVHSCSPSLSLNGLSSTQAKDKVLAWLESHQCGKATVTYKLRDWLFSRQRYWGEPFPLFKFPDGTIRLLQENELPLCPPAITDYRPSGDGTSPLERAPQWIETFDPVSGKNARRESNVMPQWAGSCWYYLRFADPGNTKQAWSEEAEKYWLPVDLYVGGVEHAVLHLLYARFWHKVLYDCGFVHTKEPFTKLRNQGLIVARSYQNAAKAYVEPSQVEERESRFFDRRTGEELTSQIDKMSKSKLNGVTPDEVLEEFGADALRLYEMFMGPLDKEKAWNTDAVSGCKRFLNRFFEMATSEKVVEETSEEACRLGHILVHGVQEDLELMQFNTAIAKMMEFMNHFTKLPVYPKQVVKMATQALAPLAPHMAEEVWERLGEKELLAYAPFPKADSFYLQKDKATYVVQVNGKVRARLEMDAHASEEAVTAEALKHPHVLQFIQDLPLLKKVFVPGKLLNLVVSKS